MKCPSFWRRRPSPAASEKAKADAAKRELERVRGQWPTVLRFAAAFTEHQRENHISEKLNVIFRGGPT
jgi:hypothetical protein